MANEYIVDTNIENPRFRRDLTRDKETFDILIEKKLYPFLGTSAEQIKQSESIAKTQKANLETIHTCKQKAEDFGNSGRWSPHTSGFLGIENEKNLYSDKLKEFNIIIKDLNTIITAKDDPQSPLQEPTKRLASVIKHYIETDVKKRVDYEYQSRLIDEIKRGIRHNSSNKFQHEYSIPYKKMMDDIKALNFDQLNDFISFIHEQEEWKKDNIKSISYGRDYISGKHGTYLHSQDGTKTEITQAEYDNFDLDNYTKICDKFGKDAMPYHQVYGEYNVLKRLKNVFTEALREKVLDNYDTPFRFDYDRYTHPENAYKELDEAVEAKHKQPSWFEKMRKQFNATRDTYFTSQEQTIDEEQKPSPSQILTITDTEVKAFGSKDKAIEIRNQLMELKASDTQEDFYKRKNKIFKKLSAQYHPDKPNGSDNAQAFINKINKYVDFYLAKEFWKLPDDKRGY